MCGNSSCISVCIPNEICAEGFPPRPHNIYVVRIETELFRDARYRRELVGCVGQLLARVCLGHCFPVVDESIQPSVHVSWLKENIGTMEFEGRTQASI